MLISLLVAVATQAAPAVWSSNQYSSAVTECDRLASHPDDPHKVGPGVSQKNVDLPRAIAACQKAVAADPENPRLNYQLARAYGYSGQGTKAYPYRDKAVAGGYPQALFVIGYITLFGMNEQPRDVCRGGELIGQSARAGRFAGQVAFPHYVLQGMFKNCSWKPDRTEMLGFLASARQQTGGDFYKETLVERLEADVKSRPR